MTASYFAAIDARLWYLSVAVVDKQDSAAPGRSR